MPTIPGDPYAWPFDGNITPQNTTLIIIDMQTDFCGKGGYVDTMGYDLSLTRAPIEPIRACSTPMRAKGYGVIHTREGHRPDLADLPAEQALALARRSAPASAIPARAAASWCAANPAGTSFPNSSRCRASRSSTSPAKARSAPPISN